MTIIPTQLTPAPTAAVLIIGNEILSGRTQDVNLNHIAVKLTALGIRLGECRVVPDIEAEIVDAVRALSARYDYVFTTGGIGPTHDDITAESVAKAFDRTVVIDPEAAALLESRYGAGQVSPARMRMARVPEGATLVRNAVSAAPGFRVENVFVMAGVPAIMRAMFDELAPTLSTGPKILSRGVACNLGESLLSDPLAAIQARHPDVDIGSYPWFRQGAFGVSLVSRGTDAALLDQVTEEIAAMIRDLGGEPVFE
jgi:molybdenum cofactor synthesis domain-containing protein